MMKFIDLFSGIGGFRMALEQVGHECIAFCEIDKYARKSYEAIYGLDAYNRVEQDNVTGYVEITKTETGYKDITKVTDEEWRKHEGQVDIITGGFPCQDFSIAGNRQGLEGTRGTLFFEIARAIKEIKPRYFLLENVKGLLSHDKGRTLGTIMFMLVQLGYDTEYLVLNSKSYVPQNRERIYIVGHLRGTSRPKVFSDWGASSTLQRECVTRTPKQIGNIYENDYNSQAGRVYDANGISPTVDSMSGGNRMPKIITLRKVGHYNDNPVPQQHGNVYGANGISPTLLADFGKGGSIIPAILQLSHGYNKGGLHKIAPSVTSSNYVLNNYLVQFVVMPKDTNIYVGREGDFVDDEGNVYVIEIRRLTPRECWRLQAFPDWAFDRARKVNSDSQLYKQAGNSVTVSVVYDIVKELKV
jgi:DNA (cytosine-5)-methyltransferase 1